MKLQELQDRLFDILCIIDDICKENNICYWLTGGTELGAVREKNFIPWDDDIDIKVPIEEYRKFKNAMEEKLPEHLHLMEPDVFLPYFYDFIVRIYDDRWLLREEKPEDKAYGNFQNRVSIDVFITIGVPDSKFSRFVIMKKFQLFYLIGMSHRHKLDFKKYDGVMKFVVYFFSVFGRVYSMETIYGKWAKNALKSHKNAGKYVTTPNTVVKDFGIIEDKRIYEETVFGQIRGREFPIPKGYDMELTQRYGNYMIPVRDDKLYTKHTD